MEYSAVTSGLVQDKDGVLSTAVLQTPSVDEKGDDVGNQIKSQPRTPGQGCKGALGIDVPFVMAKALHWGCHSISTT